MTCVVREMYCVINSCIVYCVFNIMLLLLFAQNDDSPVLRKCYPCMRHMQGDTIYARDCVLLKSGSRKNDLPFIAKIANLWEDPVNGK